MKELSQTEEGETDRKKRRDIISIMELVYKRDFKKSDKGVIVPVSLEKELMRGCGVGHVTKGRWMGK